MALYLDRGRTPEPEPRAGGHPDLQIPRTPQTWRMTHQLLGKIVSKKDTGNNTIEHSRCVSTSVYGIFTASLSEVVSFRSARTSHRLATGYPAA